MEEKRKGLALFGGTFNPPHNGHIAALETVCEQLRPERVLIAPTGQPVHKDMPPDTPDPRHRLAMARLAFQPWPGVEITDCESRMSGYTADTLEWAAETSDTSPLWLVVGADMFMTIQNWHEPERVFALARIAVLCRAHGQQTEVYRHAEFLMHRYDAAVDLVAHQPVDISSTQVRALLTTGGGRKYLPDAVYDYIRKNGLYREP